jgi:hypothetical protein
MYRKPNYTIDPGLDLPGLGIEQCLKTVINHIPKDYDFNVAWRLPKVISRNLTASNEEGYSTRKEK